VIFLTQTNANFAHRECCLNGTGFALLIVCANRVLNGSGLAK